MEISASLVKKLREETDAPMLECRNALVEAEGDYERAKTILREKGKAAAAKRADRATGAGVAMIVRSDDGMTAGGVVLECETDFVAINPDFVATAEELARGYLQTDPGSDPLAVNVNGKSVGTIIEESVGKIRENIKVAKALRIAHGNTIGAYVHHDRKSACAVEVKGDASNAEQVARELALQVVALRPQFLKKDEIPQDVINREIETETNRAITEGKAPDIARKIAEGRVNKEFFQSAVLLEQPFYRDNKKSVSQFIAESEKEGGGKIDVVSYTLLAVGAQ